MTTITSVISKRRVRFSHAEYDLNTYECHFHKHEFDLDTHKFDLDKQVLLEHAACTPLKVFR
jgi:hypothetical protein